LVSTFFGILTAWPILSGALFLLPFVSIFIAALALVLHLVGRRKLRDSLRDRVASLFADQSEVASVSGALHALATEMSLKPPWRISLYEATASETWRRVARASNHIGFESGGRIEVPLDQGVLGWAQMFSTIDALLDLPDPVEDPAGYERFQASRRITAQQIRNFRMKSRSYAALSFPRGYGLDAHHAVGIVVESEIPHGLDPGRAESTLTRETVQLLHRLASLNEAISELPDKVDHMLPD
jgi:hypothetical protein